jgi:hypothetical protein
MSPEGPFPRISLGIHGVSAETFSLCPRGVYMETRVQISVLTAAALTLVALHMAPAAMSQPLARGGAPSDEVEAIDRNSPLKAGDPVVSYFDALQAGTFAAAGLLFDNGPLASCESCGSHGAPASVLQNQSLGMSSLGFSVNTSQYRLADDFEVTGNGWHIDHLVFYAYQTNSGTNSTISRATLRIWDGPPGETGSNVVWGNTISNRILSTDWTGAYRISETANGTARPIMAVLLEVDEFFSSGIYWADVAMAGTLASGPFVPPVTIPGTCTTGDALYFTGESWETRRDVLSECAQGMPFLVHGEAVGDDPSPPIADAGAEQTVLAGQSVRLDGSGSSSASGAPLAFAWSLSGPGEPALSDASDASPTFCAGLPGDYTAVLVVSDGTMASEPNATTVSAVPLSEALADLRAAVQALQVGGSLNQGQARGLTTKIDATTRHLARGMTPAAVGTLTGFRNHALSLWQNDGVLTEEQAGMLAGPAESVIGVLQHPCSRDASIGPAGGRTPDAEADSRMGITVEHELSAAYPNPSAHQAMIDFAVPAPEYVRVIVYDVSGREVARPFDGHVGAGRHLAVISAGVLASGTYIVRLSASGGFEQTRRLTVQR